MKIRVAFVARHLVVKMVNSRFAHHVANQAKPVVYLMSLVWMSIETVSVTIKIHTAIPMGVN